MERLRWPERVGERTRGSANHRAVGRGHWIPASEGRYPVARSHELLQRIVLVRARHTGPGPAPATLLAGTRLEPALAGGTPGGSEVREGLPENLGDSGGGSWAETHEVVIREREHRVDRLSFLLEEPFHGHDIGPRIPLDAVELGEGPVTDESGVQEIPRDPGRRSGLGNDRPH